MTIKGKIKKILKKIIGCRENETVRDAIYRHKLNLEKLFYRKKYTNDELKEVFIKSGIKENDSLMLHCGYKAFYNFTGTPNDIIKDFIDIVGEEGNIVMPCYGKNRFNFNVDEDESAAGIISETFRHLNGVVRSKGAHFSCAAYGKDKYKIINEHEKSKYGFDKYSPYYKFTELDNSKIIMLGLGKNSVKLSLYHIPEMLLLDKDEYYKSLFKKKYSITVAYNQDGKTKEIVHSDMMLREDTVPNSKEIKKLYKQNFVTHNKISNLDIVVIDAKKALKYLIDEANKKHYMIKRKRF